MISLIDSDSDRPVKSNLAKFSQEELDYWYEQKRQVAREWEVLEPIIRNIVNLEDGRWSYPQASGRSRIREDFRGDPSAGDKNSEQETPPRDEDDTRDHRERQRQSRKRRDEDEKIEVPEGVRLLEYLNRPPKPEDTLFGNRWLCRKGTAMLVGPSGIGKSTLILQGSAYWSAGLLFLNIAPARPLKIVIFGSEDDDGDLHEIVFGACAGYKFIAEQAATALANCTYYHYTKHSGAVFLSSVLDKVLERDKPDLVVLNPFQGYLGGSIHDTELTTTFIRNTLLPIVEKHNCAAMLVHHTPKTNFRNTENWSFVDWQYSSQGGADITNAMRAILVLEPTGEFGVYRLIAAKRGSRIGWADDFGETTREQLVAWNSLRSNLKWWRLATDEEISKANNAAAEKKSKSTEKAPYAEVKKMLDPTKDIAKSDLKALIMQKFNVSERTADTRINTLYALLDAHEIKIKGKPFVRFGKRPEEAVDFDYDDDAEAQKRPAPKPKPEDILALIPERGSKLKRAVISAAGRLTPPIGKDKAQGLIAELLDNGQAFLWSAPVAIGHPEIHLSRHVQKDT